MAKDFMNLDGISLEFYKYVHDELRKILGKDVSKFSLLDVRYTNDENLDEQVSFSLPNGRHFKARMTNKKLKYFMEITIEK